MKDKINRMIQIFTKVVTLVFIVSSLFTMAFCGLEASISLREVWAIMLIGVVSAVGYLPILSEREYSKFMMAFLQVAHFLIINAVTILIGIHFKWGGVASVFGFVCFEFSIILVYVIVIVISYKVDSDFADQMNERLKHRQ